MASIGKILKKYSLKELDLNDLEILLAKAIRKSREFVISHPEYKLTKAEMTKAENYFSKRLNKEPLALIVGRKEFYGIDFIISKHTLIPRPETEILIDKVCEVAKEIEAPRILEIGVGSGIISIMIAKLLKEVSITATDISKEALHVAKINAKNFGVEKQITFHHTPYMEGIHERFDIIISNPPYIAKDAKVAQNLSYEPDIALFGGEVGDEVLKHIIDIACYHDNCILCCEMGYDQKISLGNYMHEKGIQDITFYKDLSGFDRGFIAHIGGNHQQ